VLTQLELALENQKATLEKQVAEVQQEKLLGVVTVGPSDAELVAFEEDKQRLIQQYQVINYLEDDVRLCS
jgi:hypothetical protein